MKQSFYETYLEFDRLGRKKEAKAAIESFVASFGSLSEKANWSHEFLAMHEFGERIRHEIYEYVVFPVLLDGFQRGDHWSICWLVGTRANLRATHLWKKVFKPVTNEEDLFSPVWLSGDRAPIVRQAKLYLLARVSHHR